MLKLLLSLSLLIVMPSLAAAWGEMGHRAVAEIAQRHLTDRAKFQALELLDGIGSLAGIATWADEHRDEHPETYNWHLVYMPMDAVRYERARHCPSEICIVEKIGETVATLRDATRAKRERAEALKLLVHLVGDIHMPLHVLAPLNRPTGLWIRIGDNVDSLHLWWDNGFVDAIASDSISLADDLEKSYPPERRRDWRQGTPEAWANESFVFARDFIRKNGIDSLLRSGEGTRERPISLPSSIIAETRSIVMERILIAGLRLSRLINESLK